MAGRKFCPPAYLAKELAMISLLADRVFSTVPVLGDYIWIGGGTLGLILVIVVIVLLLRR